ncbi:hypothetical protein Q9233_013770 [Columba guinea]|nr:hypothetical protein Q9233_013770 [Columba guinea]
MLWLVNLGTVGASGDTGGVLEPPTLTPSPPSPPAPPGTSLCRSIGPMGPHGLLLGALGLVSLVSPVSPGAGGAQGPPAGDAAQEHGYYLGQLFGQYGANGTLPSEGLARLLGSLGLGRVRVVQIQHEELGHGHVTHLDLLEVQDDKHRHRHPPRRTRRGPRGIPQCLNVTQLLVNFGLGAVSRLTPEQFTLLCPALLYQIDSRVCIRHRDEPLCHPCPLIHIANVP